MRAPPQLGTADFPGQGKTGDGRYGAALTVADGYSRFLPACPALRSTAVHAAKPLFTRVGHEFGLPPRLRTDHGVPFATTTLARRAPLSAWWVRLGRRPACIQPGKPRPNGRHARRQRTLPADTTRPPAANRRAPQQRCTRVREEVNPQRPHAALDRRPRAAWYAPSPSKRPHQLPPLESPDRVAGRSVSAHGGRRWPHRGGNVSHVGVGDDVGLEEIDGGVWHVDCGPRKRGRFRERHRRIEEAEGRLKRRR